MGIHDWLKHGREYVKGIINPGSVGESTRDDTQELPLTQAVKWDLKPLSLKETVAAEVRKAEQVEGARQGEIRAGLQATSKQASHVLAELSPGEQLELVTKAASAIRAAKQKEAGSKATSTAQGQEGHDRAEGGKVGLGLTARKEAMLKSGKTAFGEEGGPPQTPPTTPKNSIAQQRRVSHGQER